MGVINIKDLIEKNVVVPVSVSFPLQNVAMLAGALALAIAAGIIVGNKFK
jgi:hypothetical protein